jgi:hypothetical protein
VEVTIWVRLGMSTQASWKIAFLRPEEIPRWTSAVDVPGHWGDASISTERIASKIGLAASNASHIVQDQK